MLAAAPLQKYKGNFMKKFVLILAAALCALTAAAFGGCTEEDRILYDWKRENNYHSGDYPLSLDVRGVYGDTYVFYIDGMAAGAAITTDLVDNVYFAYPSTRQLEVYNDGEFYTLSSAFEAGLLSHEDLLDIQKNYNDGWNWSTGGIIRQEYLQERGDSSLTIDDIVFEVYWAGYEQFVLFISAESDDFDTELVTEIVDGVEFTYPTSQTLLFYGAYNAEAGTHFNTLSWAFESGYLSRADLLTVKQNYESETIISIDK